MLNKIFWCIVAFIFIRVFLPIRLSTLIVLAALVLVWKLFKHLQRGTCIQLPPSN